MGPAAFVATPAPEPTAPGLRPALGAGPWIAALLMVTQEPAPTGVPALAQEETPAPVPTQVGSEVGSEVVPQDGAAPPEGPGSFGLSWLSPFPWWVLLLVTIAMAITIVVMRRPRKRAAEQNLSQVRMGP